jgi:hypothetical protein
MERTGRLALLLTLLLASVCAPARANPPQQRGRGLNTREFDTQTPAEKEVEKEAGDSGLCIDDVLVIGMTEAEKQAARRVKPDLTRGILPLCGPQESSPAWYLSFYDFDLLVVSDSQGNTDRLYEEEVALKRVEDAAYHSLCPEVLCVMVIVSTGQSFTFKFKSTGRPMRLDLVRGVGNTHPDVAVRYHDLSLSRGTWALLKLTPVGLEDLRVDADGDGSFETTVKPTASAGGPAARDTDGPVITFDSSARGTGSVLGTLRAEDPSGVVSLRYSFDGTHFKPYAGPFEVDPARVREVWAFADDRLGNRSGLYVFDARTGRRRPLP